MTDCRKVKRTQILSCLRGRYFRDVYCVILGYPLRRLGRVKRGAFRGPLFQAS
jgi:hypothetical protein